MGIAATLSLLAHSSKVQLMMPLILFNGMSLAFIVGDVTRDISNEYFGLSTVLIVTSVFYGPNAFCGVVLMGSCVVSLLFGKLAAGRLGRRGCCAVAFGTQAVAFLLIILYHFNYDHSFWDYLILYTVITLLAAGDSIWESQVGECAGRDH